MGFAVKEPYLLKNYYWTGGTVLAEFYLHHRESEDIDLFSENEVAVEAISNIDFNYYPFPRINLGENWKGLAIDSLEDIAVNKVHTLFMKPRSRDFVDLYFILKLTKKTWRNFFLTWQNL